MIISPLLNSHVVETPGIIILYGYIIMVKQNELKNHSNLFINDEHGRYNGSNRTRG